MVEDIDSESFLKIIWIAALREVFVDMTCSCLMYIRPTGDVATRATRRVESSIPLLVFRFEKYSYLLQKLLHFPLPILTCISTQCMDLHEHK